MRDQGYREPIRWLLVRNVGSVAIPPFGVMVQIGFDDTDGARLVSAATIDNQCGCLLNGETPIPSYDPTDPVQSNGQGTATLPGVAAYQADNAAGAVPQFGDTWGVKAGSLYLHLDSAGLYAADSTGSNQLVNVRSAGVPCNNPTTTTTTTAAPCPGTCLWTWNNGSSTWTLTTNSCSAGCACAQPGTCPVGFACSKLTTGCVQITVGGTTSTTTTQNCATTTTPPPATTTTCPPGCRGNALTGWRTPCLWTCVDNGVGGTAWVSSICGCNPDSGGLPCNCCTLGGQPPLPCNLLSTISGICATGTCGSDRCSGTCAWQCDGANWFVMTGSCVSINASCACTKPTTPCSNACDVAVTPCSPPTTTTQQPCHPTNCTWQCAGGGGGWSLTAGGGTCTGTCCCPYPPDACCYLGQTVGTICQSRAFGCGSATAPCDFTTTTTTTTTPPTTTTTTCAPGSGTWTYTCESGAWVHTSGTCGGGFVAPAPPAGLCLNGASSGPLCCTPAG